MTVKLYFAPGACSFVPHALLEMAEVPFEPALVKLHKGENLTAEYKAVNPRGQVPVLVDGNDTITQILAIVHHLDGRYPEQHFLPADAMDRTRVLETLAWMNNTVHPTFTHVFMPHKFATTPEGQADIKAHNARLYADMLAEIDAIALGAAELGEPFMAGPHFGPVDAYSLVLLRWGGFAGIDPTSYRALWAHVQRIAELPGVARAIERERLQLNLYKAA
jgi:glutathione S-transferase